jgi:hypothetical protein
LLPGSLTPGLAEHVAYIGAQLPFSQARAMVERCCRVALSEATVRRRTYAAGTAARAVEETFVAKLEKTLERSPQAGPPRQQVSADGAMVRTRDGSWKEVRCLVIGTVSAGKDGPVLSAQSYAAGLCDHERFIRDCRGEFYRRGTENVIDVEAVMDGAEWLGKLVEEHCPTALRILDFTHAADAVIAAAHAAFGQGTQACAAWIGPQLHELRHGDSQKVLTAMLALIGSETLGLHAVETIVSNHGYLARREAQIRYAAFSAAGYSIGSGSVESANKHVVLARLRGAGMQWAVLSVNAILALRCADRSNRWEDVWGALTPRLRPAHRKAPLHVTPQSPVNAPPLLPVRSPLANERPNYFEDGKPTKAHPYNRYPACRTKQ